VLAEYNAQVGGSAANARRLDDAFCVVSGQQVGLLLGPAYTCWKLFTTINAARRLSEDLGVDVVPVFWIESEDHDWDEVNRFFVRETKLSFDTEVPAGAPVAEIEVDPEPFLARVRAELGQPGDPDAWRLVAPERAVARWHVRNLARLCEGLGVVFVEPRLLREPLREFAASVAAEPGRVDESLRRPTGFPPRLSPPEGNYFFDARGGRTRVPRGAPLPERWSTDVATRVLVQNAALPALAAVCGPAECDYWAQLGPAHAAFGVPFPAVLPRNAATLVEQGVARDAARMGVDLEQVVLGAANAPAPARDDPVAGRLRDLRAEADRLLEGLDGGAIELPANTDKPFRKTLDRLREDLARLADRLDDARAEADGAGRRRFERILRELRPRGGFQERTHSLFLYLLRHGPGLAAELRESFDPFESGHYLVQL